MAARLLHARHSDASTSLAGHTSGGRDQDCPGSRSGQQPSYPDAGYAIIFNQEDTAVLSWMLFNTADHFLVQRESVLKHLKNVLYCCSQVSSPHLELLASKSAAIVANSVRMQWANHLKLCDEFYHFGGQCPFL